MDAKVLIVGAGPTGLAMALWLARSGVAVRIVERSRGPGEASRAIAVHARTLELYRQLGIDREIVAAGILVERLMLRRGRREIAALRIGDFGRGLSPYPFVLSLPQDEHERLLGAALQRLGVAIEWDTRLESFVDDGARVRAVLSRAGQRSDCVVDFIAGCDGAHSTVREQLGIAFPGGTYEQRFFVADVEATGVAANQDLNVCLSGPTFCIVLPVRSLGSTRLIGVVPPEFGDRDVTFEDLRSFAEDLCGLEIGGVNWFSTYHVHHRVAERFRVGRAFLCGDAAHIHSPAGGQGMNTGIGDALNLAWKLGAVTGGKAGAAILDSYEPERMAFARVLVATTDRAFRGAVGTGLFNRLFRTTLLPTVVPLALQFAAPRRAMFRLLSQTRIAYPSSPLSRGTAGRVRGGDRLPWAGDGTIDNYAPLQSLDWQLHIHGDPSPALAGWAAQRGLPLYRFPWTPKAKAAGFARDAAYLVRPDGYVAVAARATDVASLQAYATALNLAPRAP